MKNFHINKRVREANPVKIKIYNQMLKTGSQLLIIGKMLACNLANTIYYGPVSKPVAPSLGRKLGDWPGRFASHSVHLAPSSLPLNVGPINRQPN